VASRTLWVVLSSGFVALLVGFLWGALFAGVPYQDATPEQNASFSFHSNVAFGLMVLGVCLLVLGVSGFISRRLARRKAVNSRSR